MAKLIRLDDKPLEKVSKDEPNEDENMEKEVLDNDNDDLIDKAEELGVPFGCTDGRCGSCRVEVVDGMDNLSDRTQNELDMGLDDSENYRLICQCKIKENVVKIRV